MTRTAAVLVALLLPLASCDSPTAARDATHGSDLPPAAASPSPAARVLAGGSVTGRGTATLAVVSGADVVRIRATDLGDRLYRLSTPTNARVAPTADLDGDTVLAGLTEAAGAGPAVLTVEISTGVRWRLRLGGGAKEQLVDLTGGRVSGVDLTAGSTVSEITLPAPTGTVRVALGGGASRLLVRLAGAAPARARVGGGAGTVTVDGVRRAGVGGGTTIEPPAWASAPDRYDIDLSSGVSDLTVERV